MAKIHLSRAELEEELKTRFDDCDEYNTPNELRARIIATYFYSLVGGEESDYDQEVTLAECPAARRSSGAHRLGIAGEARSVSIGVIALKRA